MILKILRKYKLRNITILSTAKIKALLPDSWFTYKILHLPKNRLQLSTFDWVPKMENEQEDLLEKPGVLSFQVFMEVICASSLGN